ncbi:MAG: hypothetical protein NXI00_10845 [Cytophagales bacterium]|nr:hypothetical protein [Cytophagales bacterium]
MKLLQKISQSIDKFVAKYIIGPDIIGKTISDIHKETEEVEEEEEKAKNIAIWRDFQGRVESGKDLEKEIKLKRAEVLLQYRDLEKWSKAGKISNDVYLQHYQELIEKEQEYFEHYEILGYSYRKVIK